MSDAKNPYHYCFVPFCKNTSVSTPEKRFITVPKDRKTRKRWWQMAHREYPVKTGTTFCCEDHFNLEKDLQNYRYVITVGGRAKLKAGVVPHIFEWQKRDFEGKGITSEILSNNENVDSGSDKVHLATDSPAHTQGNEDVEGVIVEATSSETGAEEMEAMQDCKEDVKKEITVGCSFLEPQSLQLYENVLETEQPAYTTLQHCKDEGPGTHSDHADCEKVVHPSPSTSTANMTSQAPPPVMDNAGSGCDYNIRDIIRWSLQVKDEENAALCSERTPVAPVSSVRCGFLDCQNSGADCFYYRTPCIVHCRGDDAYILSKKRREMWKERVGRQDLLTEEDWDRTVVCHQHFFSQKKAHLLDTQQYRSWLPLKKEIKVEEICKYVKSTEEEDKPGEKEEEKEGKGEGKEERTTEEEILGLSSASDSGDDIFAVLMNVDTGCEKMKEIKPLLTETWRTLQDKGVQTVIDSYSSQYNLVFSRAAYLHSFGKVQLYTGLPSIRYVDWLFEKIAVELKAKDKNLNDEMIYQKLLITLVKLRKNYTDADIACQLNMTETSVVSCFLNVVDILYKQLYYVFKEKQPSVSDLPTQRSNSLTEQLRDNKVALFDCFEVFIARKCSADYNYFDRLRPQTLTYQIGLNSNSDLIYVSQGLPAYSIDFSSNLNLGQLRTLLVSNHVMMPDGLVKNEVRLYKVSEDPVYVVGNRYIPQSIKLQEVEEVNKYMSKTGNFIGKLLKSYRIFESKFPLTLVKPIFPGAVTYVDKIVTICCYLQEVSKWGVVDPAGGE